MTLKIKHKLSLTSRWRNARPGSVLILVVALLVLLALIGTAYLSSTQAERYTSAQNTINTEADLLIKGVVDTVNAQIAGGLFGNTTNGTQYRPPQQEMPLPAGAVTTGYNHYTSTSSDPLLADRLPLTSPATIYPYWNAISWPLFSDTSGNSTFDSPFDASTTTYIAANKSKIQVFPTYKTYGGQLYPGVILYVPSTSITNPTVLQWANGLFTVPAPNGAYIAPGQAPGETVPGIYAANIDTVPGVAGLPPPPSTLLGTTANITKYAALITLAGSAAGDGIADSAFVKLPVGQVDGITYYAATRVIDGNSAINANTAWSVTNDTTLAGATQTNYGFFRSNIGLAELLNQSTPNSANELSVLNAYRINGTAIPPTTPTTPYTWNIDTMPVDDTGASRSDFGWFSVGDAMDQQLARRPGSPGYSTSLSTTGKKFSSFGVGDTAALAYHFSLTNPNAGYSSLESVFQAELLSSQSTPLSPAQVNPWYLTNFNYPSTLPPTSTIPLRPLLTASNAVSNAMPSRLGNLSSPPTWAPGKVYNFGDWVMDGPTGQQRSFVCIQPHTSVSVVNSPMAPVPPSTTDTLYNPGGVGYWAGATATPSTATGPYLGLPFTTAPSKVSINTATFEQLWLGFCHVMTDSVAPATSATATAPMQVPQWLPPMLPTAALQTTYVEQQMPMFRSVIRDNRSVPISNSGGSLATFNTGSTGITGIVGAPVVSPTFAKRIQLTPMQMMQLRAAIAAINTQSMRNAPASLGGPTVPAQRLVRSRNIVLADTSGTPAYDVEVFGNDIQPFIAQMFAQVNSAAPTAADSFIAIQLVNPYATPIVVTPNWGIGTIDRSKYTGATAPVTPPLTLTAISPGTPITGFTIPAATATGPGTWVIYEGSPPAGITLTPATSTLETGLTTAIGKEVVILKPRLLTGAASSQISAVDNYTEAAAGGVPNLYDLVPVDQIDMTGTDKAFAAKTPNLYYRRAGNPIGVAPAVGSAWNFVWPGFYTPYNPNNPTTGVTPLPTTPPSYTPSAVITGGYQYNQSIVASATAPTSANLNLTIVPGGAADTTGQTSTEPTYNTISLQVLNDGFPGPNPVITSTSTNGNTFPFGGFARNADMLQIPYIGAYRICKHNVSASLGFYEMNSVTMDSSLANDSTLQPSAAYTMATYQTAFPSGKVIASTADYTVTAPSLTIKGDLVTDPFVEQIGRFCPIGGYVNRAPPPLPATNSKALTLTQVGAATNPPITTNPPLPLDNAWLLDFGTDNTQWHYHWAKRLFDYFTVQAPNDDYFPNVDPALADNTATPIIPAKYAAGNVLPVGNSTTGIVNATTAGRSEDQLGVEGVVNINTAPWPVLAMLPFVPRGTNNLTYNSTSGQMTVAAAGTAPLDDNLKIAQAIVAYRSAYGPFKSIMDLYSVPAFRLENDILLATDPGSAQGDFSPEGLGTVVGTTPDGVRFDFEERFLLLNHVSNLITTRSDTFTCYVLLQGWRNVGTGSPTLVVQRRAAFLLDRNTVTPTNRIPFNFNVPTE